MGRLGNILPMKKKSSDDETGLDAGFAPPSLSGLKVPAERIASVVHVVSFPRIREGMTGHGRLAGLGWARTSVRFPFGHYPVNRYEYRSQSLSTNRMRTRFPASDDTSVPRFQPYVSLIASP